MTTEYFLSSGAHKRAEDGRCAMEWVSYLAGEAHSDRPVCVSPMLQSFCISLNDALPDGRRQRLRPYLARTIGTVGDGLDGKRRWMCADWLIREYTPAWLALVPSLVADAERLRALPPMLASENVQRAMADLKMARDNTAAAWAAASDAASASDAAGAAARAAASAGAAAWAAASAGAAAWAAAWAAASASDAAGAAAGAAAWAAAGAAAWAAARAAAGDAAWAAARAAAGAAASDALAPTVRQLQDSILSPGGLLDRMLPTVALRVPVVGDAAEVRGLVSAGLVR